MNILVIFIAAAVGVSSSRSPHPYNFYRHDLPKYFESVPPPSFHRSYPEQKLHFRNSHFIGMNENIIKYKPPTYFQEERDYLDFPPLSSHLSSVTRHSFYRDKLSNFQKDRFDAQDYKGPPPPIPKKIVWKQMLQPHDEQYYNSTGLRITIPEKEHHPPSLTINNHENHINNGNSWLDHASTIGVISPDINLVAMVNLTSTTRAAMELSSTIPKLTPTMNQVENLHEKKEENSTSDSLMSQVLTTAQPTNTASLYPKTLTNVEKMFKHLDITTPASDTVASVQPQSNLTSLQEPSSQLTNTEITFPNLSYDIGKMTSDSASTVQEQLQFMSLRENTQIPHDQHHVLFQEPQNNFSIEPSYHQIYEKQENSNNIIPLRFNIPTTSIFTSQSAATVPPKLIYQNLDFSHSVFPSLSESFYPMKNDVYSKPNTEPNFEIPLEQKEYLQTIHNFEPSRTTSLEIEKFDLHL